jgi:S1-C subfamily serine protease
MKKAFSYASAFGVSFMICAFALKALYGFDPSGLLPGSQVASKQAVLTALNTPVTSPQHESVIADAAAKVEPAIVDVHTTGKAIQVFDPFSQDPFFRQFGFGAPQQQQNQEMQPKGAGSGIIISSDGYILTNEHVVKDTVKVQVTTNDGTTYDAKVIGTDPVADIAVCKVDTKGVKLPVAQLGNSDTIRIGDWAIAVGNPLDIGTTVTLGIISAKDRKDMSAEGRPLNSVIQTDAAINPGNSGGALANIDGQVIGINEAIASSAQGIGFAIPINAAKKIAAELIENGRIVRPYLGIAYGPLKDFNEQARQAMRVDVKGDDGVIISQVFPNSPAEAAGLQQYDVILEANRVKVNDTDGLNSIIQDLKVGDSLVLLVSRGGHDTIVSVKLKERPADYGDNPPQGQQSPDQQMPDQQSPDQQSPDQQSPDQQQQTPDQ